jgi:hypothetical protein
VRRWVVEWVQRTEMFEETLCFCAFDDAIDAGAKLMRRTHVTSARPRLAPDE